MPQRFSELEEGTKTASRSGVEELLQPGQSADLSFASGALSYLECSPLEKRTPTPFLSLFSSVSSPSSSQSSRSVNVSCVAKRVAEGSITESLSRSASKCTPEFASRRIADWEAVERFNLLGTTRARVAHAVPAGMSSPSKFHGDHEFWAMACILGANGACLASAWCSDGSRIVSEIGPDTVGDTRLMVGQKALLLQGVHGVYNRCFGTNVCQKSKFAGQSRGRRTREDPGGLSEKNGTDRKQPAGEGVQEDVDHSPSASEMSDGDGFDTRRIEELPKELAQMEKVPLWYLECSNEYLGDVQDVAAVYDLGRDSFVKMGWANDKAATIYCRTSSGRPPHALVRFSFPFAALWPLLVLFVTSDLARPWCQA